MIYMNIQFFGGRGGAGGKRISSNIDFSVAGTSTFDGQKAPSDLPKFRGALNGNPEITYQGTKYGLMEARDWDSSRGGEYIAGYTFTPQNNINKGSFFLTENNELYQNVSQYLRDKASSRARGESLEEYRKGRRQRGF